MRIDNLIPDKPNGFALENLLAIEVFGCKRASANDEKSSTWEGLGEVVERMCSMGWRVTLELDLADSSAGCYTVAFANDTLLVRCAQSAPIAPVAAALAAIEAVRYVARLEHK